MKFGWLDELEGVHPKKNQLSKLWKLEYQGISLIWYLCFEVPFQCKRCIFNKNSSILWNQKIEKEKHYVLGIILGKKINKPKFDLSTKMSE
jgi:hypothetical protein